MIFFNNAATTWPKPKSVIKAVNDSLKGPYAEHGRSTGSSIDYVHKARQSMAAFLDAEEKSIIFTLNATHALNSLIHGFVKRNQGIHVITTDLEHNSVLRPLFTLETEGSIKLSIAQSTDGYMTLQAIKEKILGNTRLVVMTHASNVLGTMQDIGKIGKFLRKHEISFFVDGAQSAGYGKFSLADVDAFAFTGHKALYGFQGIGGFYIRDPGLIAPIMQGGTGVRSDLMLQPDEMPLKLEAGTHNYPALASLVAGIDFVNGHDAIGNTMSMTKCIINGLDRVKNISLYTKAPDIPIISFNIHGINCEDAGFILENKYGIICRTGLHCAPLIHKRIDGGLGCVRLSLSCHSTIRECQVVLKAIREIADAAN